MELKENNKFLNTGNGEIRDCTICDENRVERIDCDVTTDRECVDIYDSDSPLTCENDIGNINTLLFNNGTPLDDLATIANYIQNINSEVDYSYFDPNIKRN